jgi:hypothetical protein
MYSSYSDSLDPRPENLPEELIIQAFANVTNVKLFPLYPPYPILALARIVNEDSIRHLR